MNVVDDDEFELILIDPRRQIDKHFVVLIEVVDMDHVDPVLHHSVSQWGCLLLHLSQLALLCQEVVLHLCESLVIEELAYHDIESIALQTTVLLWQNSLHASTVKSEFKTELLL